MYIIPTVTSLLKGSIQQKTDLKYINIHIETHSSLDCHSSSKIPQSCSSLHQAMILSITEDISLCASEKCTVYLNGSV